MVLLNSMDHAYAESREYTSVQMEISFSRGTPLSSIPCKVMQITGNTETKKLMDLKCGRDLCCRLSNTVCLDAAPKERVWISWIGGLLPTLEMAEGPFRSLQPSKINLFPITTWQESRVTRVAGREG